MEKKGMEWTLLEKSGDLLKEDDIRRTAIDKIDCLHVDETAGDIGDAREVERGGIA